MNDFTNPTKFTAWPVLLVCFSVFIWAGFQAKQLYGDYHGLRQSYDSQVQQLDQGDKIRKSLEQIANELTNLAQQGDSNAKAIITDLKNNGIVFSADKSGAPTSPPAAGK